LSPDPILLVLLGGFLALDGTSVGQFMVSRPLIAGTLAGWFLGDPFLGLLVGGLIELYFIPVFPVGGADFPEGGPPTLVGVAAAAGLPGAGGIALGVVMGLLWSRLAAFSIQVQRKANGWIVPDPTRAPVTARRLVWAHLSCIGLDFCRGCVLTLLGLAVVRFASGALDGLWPLSPSLTLGLLILGAALPAGAFVRSLGGWRKRGVLFAAGAGGFLIASILL
jgi:mannose/fructose/N-acetylgalactosamine-specific phosphotransferase system component IIC